MIIPPGRLHLLEDPHYGVLATIRPDDTAQASPMWFLLDGDTLRFTHTTKRAKYRNLMHNPSMSLAVIDPVEPFKYIEVRGRLRQAIPDPEGAFYVVLGKRYGNDEQQPPPDSADRVILVMAIESVATQ